jgi:hypothetical protein
MPSPKAQVLGQGADEDERILLHQADAAAHRREARPFMG